MSVSAPPRKLFVYGTLCDSQLFSAVAGAPITRFHPVPARARETRAVLAADEPMPMIVRGRGTTRGLLLTGLGVHAWRRISFYEDDIYQLAPIRLRSRLGNRIHAHTFWPRTGTPIVPRLWNFREWQHVHKARALVATRRFMDYFDAPPGTDLVQAWRDIKLGLSA